MSQVYDKSISSKYKLYFEQTSEFVKTFRRFSLSANSVTTKDVKNSHSWETGRAGVPLALISTGKEVVVDHTDAHTLVIGPTGSKKSRLIAMPSIRILGSEKESMIISDPKAELYNRTADYLAKQNYDIYVLNLRSPLHGDCWNPLSIPYNFFCNGEIDRAYEFVNDIAENLIKVGQSNNDPFWDNSAGSFFFGLTTLLFKYCKEYDIDSSHVHIGNVIRLRNAIISKQGSNDNRIWKYAKTDNIISSALVGTVETANDTRAGILSVFDQKVRGFSMQPNLLDMLSLSSINLDLVGKKPTAIFLILPDEKTGYHNLVSLFIKQSYEYIIFNAQRESEADIFHVGRLRNRVNFILDEFSSLPTISDFPAMITASRSRNIRFTLIIQSKHQLIQRYKEETETIQTNCNNWIFLTSREIKLLEEISSLCGRTTDNNAKPVLSVAALQRLDKNTGEALVLSGRSLPYIAHLPDIDEYDGNNFVGRFIQPRKFKELPIIDFEIPFSEEEKVQDQFKWLPTSLLRGHQFTNIDGILEHLKKEVKEIDENAGTNAHISEKSDKLEGDE